MLNDFPQGFADLLPDYRFHPPKPGESSSISINVSLSNQPATVNPLAIQAQRDLERKRQQILADASQNPRQAIAEALSLPECLPSSGPDDQAGSCPRADTLLEVAHAIGKRNPSATKDALSEVRKSLSPGPLMIQAKLLDDAAALYADIGDYDGADKTLKEALQVADRLYARDNDSDDLNRALKGVWPSTNRWRRCVQLAASFSPQKAEEIIAGIRDPEIATFEKVYFARSLLGTPLASMDVAVSAKSRSSTGNF